MEKRTPLYERHVKLGARMASFAGYSLPLWYSDIAQEHMAVREKAGLFDVSHMGEIIICGEDALKNINYLFSNDFSSMQDGRVRYSTACNEKGGVLDDLVVYRMEHDNYFIVVNAANREKDYEWMKAHCFGKLNLEDHSDQYAQLALQGPLSQVILKKLTHEQDLPEKYYHFNNHVTVAGIDCLVSQTGYTGEFGYELYCAPTEAGRLWDAILEAGDEFSIRPCGLGARDSLRMEAAMPLYGHEMNEEISPLETGLGFAVKMDKADFIGKEALLARGEPSICRVGLKMTGRGIAREENLLYLAEDVIGRISSGGFCPYLKGAYAMALVDAKHAAEGTKLQVDVRGRKIDAEIVPLPFYKRKK